MNRRGFIAALFAPFVARFRKLWPKPETPPIALADVFFRDTPLFSSLKARQLGNSTINQALLAHRMMVWQGEDIVFDGTSPYWHGKLPVVAVNLKPVPWAEGSTHASA